MCSLSWIRRRDALIVVMNRDERRDRAPARPPRRWRGADGGFTAPVDGDAGGTWIAAKDSGVVLALLNHQAPDDSGVVGAVGAGRRISRGLLVTTLAARSGGARMPHASAPRGSPRMRRSGCSSRGRRCRRGCSPGTDCYLSARRLDPRLGFLTSSSWNPRAVIPARHARFRAFARAHPRPTRADLLAFHAQADDPRGTPWAICMARDDARTVSTTVVDVGPSGVAMRYRAR